MYVALNNDGSYKIYNKIEKVYKNISYIKYLILETSTDLKGPLCTIIDTMNMNVEYGDIEVTIDVEYDCIDCPCDDMTTFSSIININNIERFYSIHPLIKQMLTFNYFMDTFMYDGPKISISGISLYNDTLDIQLYSYSMSDEKINHLFKKLRMDTCVSKVTKYNHFIILKNGEWYVSKTVPKHFDYVGIEIIGTESLYLLSENQYKLLNSITMLTIKMKDGSIFDNTYLEDVIDSRGDDEILDFSTNNLSTILGTCVFFPQMLLLEHSVYNHTVSLEIIVETKALTYNLKITEKESEYGICLFDILNKLLNI